MKYIITDSQQDILYDHFLTLQFGELTKLENAKQRINFGYNTFPGHIFWKNDDGEIVFELDSMNRLWISKNIWDTFSNFFGLEFYDTIAKAIKSWVTKHIQLNDVKIMQGHHKNWERWENLISESKIDTKIMDVIVEMFDDLDINQTYREDRNGNEIDACDFYVNDYSDDDLLFTWYGEEFYKSSDMTDYYHQKYLDTLIEKAPIVAVYQPYYDELTSYFGDKWKPIFKKWFESRTDYPVKTIPSPKEAH
jgi:hypothetical protein